MRRDYRNSKGLHTRLHAVEHLRRERVAYPHQPQHLCYEVDASFEPESLPRYAQATLASAATATTKRGCFVRISAIDGVRPGVGMVSFECLHEDGEIAGRFGRRREQPRFDRVAIPGLAGLVATVRVHAQLVEQKGVARLALWTHDKSSLGNLFELGFVQRDMWRHVVGSRR